MLGMREYLRSLRNPSFVRAPVQGPLTEGGQAIVNPPPGGDPTKPPMVGAPVSSMIGMAPEANSPGMKPLDNGTGIGVGDGQELGPAKKKARYLSLQKSAQEMKYPESKKSGALGGDTYAGIF
jgi:hypothetical protein